MSRPSLRALTIASSATRLAVAPACDAHRVADRAAAELQHDVVAEIGQQLVHLAGVDAAGGDRHHLAQVGPVLLEEDAALQVDRVVSSRQTL